MFRKYYTENKCVVRQKLIGTSDINTLRTKITNDPWEFLSSNYKINLIKEVWLYAIFSSGIPTIAQTSF